MKTKKTKTAPAQDNDQNEDYKDAYHRALADYQNLQKRVEREKDQIVDFSSSVILYKFLEVFDNLLTAQNHLKDSGLEMVIAQFRRIFEEESMQEIKIEPGITEFNPHFHEAVTQVEGEPEGTVAEVIKVGYTKQDKVIRPASVTVYSKNK